MSIPKFRMVKYVLFSKKCPIALFYLNDVSIFDVYKQYDVFILDIFIQMSGHT